MNGFIGELMYRDISGSIINFNVGRIHGCSSGWMARLMFLFTDNGCFTELGFRQVVAEAMQTIYFFRVGAHHQSGIIE